MAKIREIETGSKLHSKSKQKRTGIGKPKRKTKPRNKKKRASWKRYRGQGKR